MSGTTNISGDLPGAPDAPCRLVASLSPRSSARGGTDPSDGGGAHRTRRQRPYRARAGASAAALPRGARRGLDELRGAVEGGARARGHREASPRQGRLVQAPARQSLYGGAGVRRGGRAGRSEEHTSELQSPCNLVCRLLLEKKKQESTARIERRSA